MEGQEQLTPKAPFKTARKRLLPSETQDGLVENNVKVSRTIHKEGGIFFEEETQYGRLYRFGLLSHERGNCYYVHDRKMRLKMVPKKSIVQIVNLEDGDECMKLSEDGLSPPVKVVIRKNTIPSKEMAINTKVHITMHGCESTIFVQDILFTQDQLENLTHAAKVVYMEWEFGSLSSSPSSIKSPPEKLLSYAFGVKQDPVWKSSV